MIEIINKQLLLQLVGYLCYWQMGFNSVFKGLTSCGVVAVCDLPHASHRHWVVRYWHFWVLDGNFHFLCSRKWKFSSGIYEGYVPFARLFLLFFVCLSTGQVLLLFSRLYDVSTSSCAHLTIILYSSSSCLCHSSLLPLILFPPSVL